MVRVALDDGKIRHTEAVTALNAPSHEPKSESIADLVCAEVVSGPGVSRIGSFKHFSFMAYGARPAGGLPAP